MRKDRDPGRGGAEMTAHRTTPLRVLVLEDEPLILMELCFALEDHGADPVSANTVAKALSALEDSAPDAAILDVNLGRGTTCEPVAKALRARGIPFLIHSGDLVRQGELISRIDAEVIPKPADSADVVERALMLADRAPG